MCIPVVKSSAGLVWLFVMGNAFPEESTCVCVVCVCVVCVCVLCSN